MKKQFLLFTLLFSVFISKGQVIRFNKTYEIQDTATWTSTIIETDTGYIIKGAVNQTITGYIENKIAFFYFDKYGNMVKWKYYGDPAYIYWESGHNDLKKDFNGNYITAGTKESYMGGAIYLFKFTPSLDILWEKTIFHVDSFTDDIEGLAIDKNNNYILFGGTFYDEDSTFLPQTTSNTWYNPFILKTDSMGNLIYHRVIGYGEGYLSDLTIDENNHYWASGTFVGILNNKMPTIFECDSNSQLLLSKNFGPNFYDEPYSSNTMFIFHSSYDSTQIAYGAIQTRSNIVFHYNESYLAKLKNHQIAWDLYGKEDSSMAGNIATITETADHHLILAGNNDLTHLPYSVPYDSCPFVDSTGISIQILKLTSNGNCMWRRRFFIPGIETDSIQKSPFIEHLIQTQDKGFAFTGTCDWIDSYYNIHYPIWFVKTDSLGCDGTGSCSDTAMVLNLLSAPDTICSNNTTWLTFELNGLSAPFTISSSENIQISDIYFIKDPYFVFATDTPAAYQIHFWFDTSRVVPNHLYQQFPVIANTTDSIYSVTITLQGYYGRTISHTYSFIVKDCHLGNPTQINQQTFAIYPNPSAGDFTVSLPENPQGAYLTIANASGQIIKVISLNKGKTTYRFTGKLPPGTYFIGVDNGKGTVVKKLIVND